MKKIEAMLFCGVLLLCLPGCGSVKQLALESGSEYLNCPTSELEAKWIDARTYRVSGCAGEAVFVCSKLKNKCKNNSLLD